MYIYIYIYIEITYIRIQQHNSPLMCCGILQNTVILSTRHCSDLSCFGEGGRPLFKQQTIDHVGNYLFWYTLRFNTVTYDVTGLHESATCMCVCTCALCAFFRTYVYNSIVCNTVLWLMHVCGSGRGLC